MNINTLTQIEIICKAVSHMLLTILAVLISLKAVKVMDKFLAEDCKQCVQTNKIKAQNKFLTKVIEELKNDL